MWVESIGDRRDAQRHVQGGPARPAVSQHFKDLGPTYRSTYLQVTKNDGTEHPANLPAPSHSLSRFSLPLHVLTSFRRTHKTVIHRPTLLIAMLDSKHCGTEPIKLQISSTNQRKQGTKTFQHEKKDD